MVRCGILNTKRENMIRRLLEALKLVKPPKSHLPQANVSGSAITEISMELSKEMKDYINLQDYMKQQIYNCMGIPAEKRKRKWWQFWHCH